jgi:prevent-host-death family protein
VAVEVGVREFRESLSEWLDRAAAGEDVIVTERGKPKVRLSAATGEHIIDQLVREGRARAAVGPRGPAPRPVPVKGNPATEALLTHRRAKEY